MPDHLTPHHVVCHCGRTLAPAGHVALCDACRGQEAEGDNFDNDVRAFFVGLETDVLTEDDHLESDRLIAHVRGEMDEVERIITVSHLEVCPMCAREARELQNFKDEIAPTAPPPFPAAQPSPWIRLLNFWNGINVARLGYAAGLGAALIVVAVVSLAPWQSQSPVRPTRSEQTPPPNPATGGLASSLPTPETAPEPSPPGRKTSGITSEVSRHASPMTVRRRVSPSTPHSSPPASRPLLALNDGGARVVLDERGQITGLRRASSEVRSLVADALASGRIATAALEGIAGRPGVTLKGTAEEAAVEFEVLNPAGTVVMTDRPVFRWTAVPNATGYNVTVVRRGQVQVASSGTVNVNEWRPPAGLFRPGVIYRWGVTAALADGSEMGAPGATAPEARFRVLEPLKAARVRRLAARHSRSPLSLGVLYAQAGLVDDAERQFELLVRQNPHSTVAHKLRQSVRGLRAGASAETR